MDTEGKQRKSRNWCFTIHDWDKMDPHVISDMKRELSAAQYWVMGKEVCPTTGRKHLQGFVRYTNAVYWSRIQKALNGTKAHIEWCRGDAEQNEKYCKKDGDFEEWGAAPISRKRKGEQGAEAQKQKWANIVQAAKKGKWQELEDEYPREFITSFRTLKAMRADSINVKETIQGELEHEWLWGESGAGKSSRARREHPDLYLKDVDGDTAKWWDMYDGEEVVLIEDLSPFNKSMTDALKKWSDRYPFKAQVKGAYMQIRPKKIIVTSQYRIDEIWEDEKTRAALHRRFIEIEVDKDEEAQERLEAARAKEQEKVEIEE